MTAKSPPTPIDNSDDQGPARAKNGLDKRLYIVFLIIFTEVSGFILVMPIFPFLGLELGLNEFEIGLIGSIFSVCQLFASPITGKLSDRYGRKPILLLSQTSTFVGFLLLGFADNVLVLILARLIDGLLGSNMTVAQAVISDLTDEDNRTKAYSYSTGVFGAGLIVGPAIASILVQINYSIPMFFAAGISMLSIILVIFLLPETNPNKTDELSLKMKDIVPVRSMKKFIETPPTNRLLITFFLYTFGFMLCVNNLTLYTIAKFGVSAQQSALYRTVSGIFRVLLQTFLVDRLIKWKGEQSILRTGIIALIGVMISMMLSPNWLWIFLPMAVLSYGGGVSRPILTSQLTKSVNHKEYATVLGVSNSLNSIAQILSPIIGGAIISYAYFELVPILSTLFFVIMYFLSRDKHIKKNDRKLTPSNE